LIERHAVADVAVVGRQLVAEQVWPVVVALDARRAHATRRHPALDELRQSARRQPTRAGLEQQPHEPRAEVRQ
jgi:hypothetical protein